MIKPSIHLNGSGREALYEQTKKAYLALLDAIQALTEAGPNMRDYYPQGSAVFYQAQNEHRVRLQALIKVKEELVELAEHIQAS